MTIMLIAAGNPSQMKRRAISQGVIISQPIPMLSLRYSGGSVGTCEDDMETRVRVWFGFPASYPYQPGTLLHWSVIDDPEDSELHTRPGVMLPPNA